MGQGEKRNVSAGEVVFSLWSVKNGGRYVIFTLYRKLSWHFTIKSLREGSDRLRGDLAEYKNGELITKGDKLSAWVLELKEYLQKV